VRAALCAALAAPGSSVPFGRGTLELRLGDARATLPEGAPFDAIFLDPFSPARAGELWEPAFLARVAGRLAPLGWLSTYSASFRVRLALAAGGLEVGLGPRVGPKGEGTLARRAAPVPALAPRVAARLARRLAALGAAPAGPN
jgi:tRNA U34 5-methylaminomethyl-2-thiouridine-forming methyltransferase MnmC